MQVEKYTFPDVPSEIEFKPIVEPADGQQTPRKPRAKGNFGKRAARISLLVALISGAFNWYNGRAVRDANRDAEAPQLSTASAFVTLSTRPDQLLEDDFQDAKPAVAPAKVQPATTAAPAAPPAGPAPSAAASEAIEPAPSTAPSTSAAVAPPQIAPTATQAQPAATAMPEAPQAAPQSPAAIEVKPAAKGPSTAEQAPPATSMREPAAVEPAKPQPESPPARRAAPPAATAERSIPPAPIPPKSAATEVPSASAAAPAVVPAPGPGQVEGPLAETSEVPVLQTVAARPRAAQKAPEQKGVVCFAGCHGLEQRLVYDRPVLMVEMPGRRPELQLASLGEPAARQPLDTSRGARRNPCIAGCYGHSRPVPLVRPAVVMQARWEIETYDWRAEPRRYHRHTAGRQYHGRRHIY